MIFRSLRKFDPYGFSKDEILEMTMRELQMYVAFTDEEIKLSFAEKEDIDVYRRAIQDRDEQLFKRLTEDV